MASEEAQEWAASELEKKATMPRGELLFEFFCALDTDELTEPALGEAVRAYMEGPDAQTWPSGADILELAGIETERMAFRRFNETARSEVIETPAHDKGRPGGACYGTCPDCQRWELGRIDELHREWLAKRAA